MPKRSRRSEDEVQAAFRIVATATGTGKPKLPKKRKNPAAVALGRLGGRVGGKARAAALTPSQRAEIARNAAMKRWGTKTD